MLTSPKPSLRPPDPPHAPPSRQQTKRAAAQRAWGFGILILLLFFALAARLWYLQVAHGDDFRDDAAANQHRRIPVRAPRGNIVDRHGVLLAANRPRLALYATPDVAKNAVVLARLAGLLHVKPDDIRQTILDTQQNPYDPLRIALDVPMAVVTQIEENKPLPARRQHPAGAGPLVSARLTGRTPAWDDGPDQHRRVERAQGSGVLHRRLFGEIRGSRRPTSRSCAGASGGTDVQIDAHGRTLHMQDTQDAVPGGTVTLTVDTPTQAAGERVFKEHDFVGAAVALDPRTGAVLAMVSAPTFDPDKFATGITAKDWDPLNKGASHPLLNRAIKAMYPPGSTFKPVVAAAGWETGAITPNSAVYLHRLVPPGPGALRVLGDARRDRLHQGHRRVLRRFLLCLRPEDRPGPAFLLFQTVRPGRENGN